jgi:Domain of Unknown Function (DUF1259)
MSLISAFSLLTAAVLSAPAQTQPPAFFESAAKVIGKSGTLNADGSFRINIARTDVTFTTASGMMIPADLGLATYAAFSGTESNALVVGDVAMLAPEIQPVIDALRAGGINLVALHNHMTSEEPRLFFMHYIGRGSVSGLAQTLGTAFKLLGKPMVAPTKVTDVGKPTVDWASLETALGVKSQTFPSGVVRFSSPRKDLHVSIDSLPFLPGMGLASWAAFNACSCGQTMVMGDTCCSSTAELQGVIDALRKGNISVTSIHNHTLGASQEVIFLHYEGEGEAKSLAGAIRQAWDVLGKG